MQATFTGQIVAIEYHLLEGQSTAEVCGLIGGTLDTARVPIDDALAHAVRIGDRLRVTVETVDEGAADV